MKNNFYKYFLIIYKSIFIISLFLISTFLVKNYIFEVTLVNGNSMYPTIHDGEHLVISKTYNFLPTDYSKGDIISVWVDKECKYYLKRIIATEGDNVKIINNRIFINDKILLEPYLNPELETTQHTEKTEWLIGKNQFFVLGDNRTNSKDSRDIGMVTKNNILGKAVFVSYPYKNIRKIKKFEK